MKGARVRVRAVLSVGLGRGESARESLHRVLHYVDDAGPRLGQDVVECGRKVGVAGDTRSVSTEHPCECGEVWVVEEDAGIALVVGKALPVAGVAVGEVVTTRLTTGMRSRTQVSKSWATIQKLPSPLSATTRSSGRASALPIAAGRPHAIAPPGEP